MSGEKNLDSLISGMAPVLDPKRYCFMTAPRGAHPGVDALMRFQEAEGDTLILCTLEAERQGIAIGGVYSRLTLTVHSDLEAVGLTAAFATCLGEANIPANVVAGYYHDHIFVPEDMAEKALAVLQALSSRGVG